MIKLKDSEFYTLVEDIRERYGVNLSKKRNLIEVRLQGILIENKFKSFSEYFKFIKSDKTGQAIEVFLDKITTHYTFFMREKEHFEFYRDKVLPYLKNKYEREKDLRIWCAGCSTGEEAYTLAMINNSYFKNILGWNKKILATDISNIVLKKAIKGEYSEKELDKIPIEWKINYLKKIQMSKYMVVPKIKSDVIFRKFNLMNDNFSFKKKIQVIFCRNVMIYFDKEKKQELVQKFYNVLDEGGYLFVGHSEAIDFYKSTQFKYVVPSVYRKQR